jgi:hypothetical protein
MLQYTYEKALLFISPQIITGYFNDVAGVTDFRGLANEKKDTTIIEQYTQVFDDKHDFINNLSILDLSFNDGWHTMDYLKRQSL